MLIALVCLSLAVGAGRGAAWLIRLWRALPRSNRDFGLV